MRFQTFMQSPFVLFKLFAPRRPFAEESHPFLHNQVRWHREIFAQHACDLVIQVEGHGSGASQPGGGWVGRGGLRLGFNPNPELWGSGGAGGENSATLQLVSN